MYEPKTDLIERDAHANLQVCTMFMFSNFERKTSRSSPKGGGVHLSSGAREKTSTTSSVRSKKSKLWVR